MDCGRPTSKNPDRWVANCPDFSREFCATLRDAVFRWEPDLTESVKWNALCFSGRKLVLGMSGCKKHIGLSLFRGMELRDPAGFFDPNENNTSIRTIRVTDPAKFNFAAFGKLLHAAVVLDGNPDIPPLPPRPSKPWPRPDFFTEALLQHRAASAFFESMAPTYQREYIVWLTTAKRPETRAQRLEQTLAALASNHKWVNRKRA